MATNDLSELRFPAEAVHGDRLVLPDGNCARSLTLPQALVLLNLMGNGLSDRIRDLVPDVSSLEISTVRWLGDCYVWAGYMDIGVPAVYDFFVLRKFLYKDGTKPLPCVEGSGPRIRIRTGAYDIRELEEILESFHETDSWSRWFEQKTFLWVLAPLINPVEERFLWLK